MENNAQTETLTTPQAQGETTAQDYKNIIETLLFITDRPLTIAKISQTAEVNNVQLTREIVGQLQQEYAQGGRAVQIIEIGGGFQMSTKAEYGRWVRKLFNDKITAKLSPAALETLAIIAYKQPVTRAEIEAIRGVDIVAPLEKIMERGLVKIVGRKDTPGKPLVYGTTDEFLRLFGLNRLSELPEMKTFSSKGPKEIQSDLPFSEPLPDIKDAILPLEDGGEDESLFNPQQEIFTKTPAPKQEEEQADTQENIESTPAAQSETEVSKKTQEVIPNGMQVEDLKELNS